MSYIILAYNFIFYQPLFNALVWFYNTIPGHDIGVSIALLTVVIRLILFPLNYQSIKSQKSLQDIQPKINALRKQYKAKEDQEKLAKEMMILYKNEKVNPFSSCLPVLIQLPFLLALYQVFIQGLKSQGMEKLYSFVGNPGTINTISLGFLNLSQPNIILAILAGLAQFWQSKMMVSRKPPLVSGKEIPGSADEKMTAIMNKQIVYFMPMVTVIIGVSLPSGLTLYWFLSTLLMALQQLWMFRKHANKEIMDLEQ
jgi:YidC/Oxa1 family membrane protein insertase